MCLLNTTTKHLLDFFDEQKPPYAILSHTWGSEEVTLQDLEKLHEGETNYPSADPICKKTGYHKIERCCDQALRDGFAWVWIDTCCIDKTNSVELSEAINSMFL